MFRRIGRFCYKLATAKLEFKVKWEMDLFTAYTPWGIIRLYDPFSLRIKKTSVKHIWPKDSEVP